MRTKKLVIIVITILFIGVSIFYYNDMTKKKDATELTPKEFLEKNK
ncbi:hypothetical protein FLGE108171_15670 [Flavobacterium gelidilacus]|jgi:cbb3-type cytochrome oxidase subunit 3